MASKKPAAIDRASTAKSGDSRRERLLDIQKREQLKGLLINKFKVKYSEKGTDLAKYIDNEVSKFLKNDRLSEDNLKKLDQRILKECELRGRKDDRKNSVDAPRAASVKGGLELDTRSVASSRMSGASKVSQTSKNAKGNANNKFDTASVRSGSQGGARAMTDTYSELDENDEWTAIQKFNTLLHYEE